jgi:SAM-dependent methyltransferase
MPARDDSGARDVLERFDRAADRYESWYETSHGALTGEAERRLLGALLGPEATPGRALEVGCGTGYFTEWLDTRYRSVVGLDPAPAMLRELRRRQRTFPVVRGDAHRLPFADGVFGAVLFLTTLEFLADPDLALREAVRVARSEVVVLWLNPWSVGAIRRRLAPGFLLSQAKRLSRRRVHTMLARSAGMRARRIEWGSTLFPWPLERRVARAPLGDVLAIKLSLAPPIANDETARE